jgi:hypothetical protein
MAESKKLIWSNREEKYFCEKGWAEGRVATK